MQAKKVCRVCGITPVAGICAVCRHDLAKQSKLTEKTQAQLQTGLLHVEVTADLDCLLGGPERMPTCRSVTTVHVVPDCVCGIPVCRTASLIYARGSAPKGAYVAEF